MKRILNYNRKEPIKLSHYNFLIKNRKAQIGETVTWVVATLIIIAILVIFVVISVAFGKAKNLASNRNVNIGESSADLIKIKTEIAYSINSQNKNKIEEWIALENSNENE